MQTDIRRWVDGFFGFFLLFLLSKRFFAGVFLGALDQLRWSLFRFSSLARLTTCNGKYMKFGHSSPERPTKVSRAY